MFVDEAKVEVRAGRGGNGALAFRREKFVPRGGPTGGDGGRGGSVILRATHNTNTLADYRHRRTVRAEDGRPGGGDNRTGRNGEDAYIEVPVGTLVHDAKTGDLLADLMEDGEEFVVAKGGDGGQGNARFATSTNRAPRRHTPGFEGEERLLRLELKLIADIGLVGFPSVGKSTIISVISSARPKIADYPFTTIVPNLGVVKWKNLREFVVADIPGLIEGAHSGQGLGIQFLRHVERTNLLVHVLEVTPQLDEQPDGRDPIADYEVIVGELEKFNPELLERPQMVVLNKIDLPYVAAREEELRTYFEDEIGLPFIAISAAAALNLDELKDRLGQAIAQGEFGEELEDWEK